MSQRRHCVVVAVLLLLIPASGSLLAAQEGGWSVRLSGTYTDPTRTFTTVEGDGTRIKTATAEAVGLSLSGEYRFSERLGLEIGVQAGYEADVALDVSNDITGERADGLTLPVDGLRFTIFDAALNIYLASGAVDFYVGPVVGMVAYDDLAFQMGAPVVNINVAVDGDVAFGGVMGLDIPCGDDGWFFTTSLKYLETSYDAKAPDSPSQEIDFDPLIVRAGFGFRY